MILECKLCGCLFHCEECGCPYCPVCETEKDGTKEAKANL
jgi:hypothetical protein